MSGIPAFRLTWGIRSYEVHGTRAEQSFRRFSPGARGCYRQHSNSVEVAEVRSWSGASHAQARMLRPSADKTSLFFNKTPADCKAL